MRLHDSIRAVMTAAVMAAVITAVMIAQPLPPSILAAGEREAAAPTFTNPLKLDVVSAADPFVYREGDTYYLYATATDRLGEPGEAAARGEGLLVWTSKDLVNWEKRRHVFRVDDRTWSRDRLWAPELFKHGGKYYLHLSAHGGQPPKPRLVLAEGESPQGPFREVKAPWFQTERATLDGHVFRDDDGELYLYFAHIHDTEPFEIHVRTLDDNLEPSRDSREVIRPTQEWEGGHTTEAPFVLRRGGTYFLTWSANPFSDDNYGVGVATAASPLGRWTKSEGGPILRSSETVFATGHHCFVDSPDGTRWFVVYHSRRARGDGFGNRELAVDRVSFVGGERPTIKVHGPTHTPQPLPLSPE
jgi:beta-xylosidase